ncbi:unnamed protein product [Schistosoma rodhaini]|uniref:LEM domain-containing protein n=1 Tax=Schistosoma rodhaini TaxID=6188 RepID=A0A183RG53_9TREM|nr:unnamed protein product [Schistosoma rodhaini]
METISDDELRSALSRYLDVVPPVTDSTRATLIAKLKKCISNGSESLLKDSPQNVVDNPATVTEDRPIQTVISENGHESPKYETTLLQKPVSTKELSASFMNGLPVQNHSSPILECVSRLPSYRRRSIHPDRPGINDPYADDLAWFPSLTPTKSREPPNKQKTFQNTKGILRENLIKSFLYVIIGLVSVILDCCFSSLSKLTNVISTCTPSLRICFCVILFGLLLCGGLYKVLLGDPFYHNPAEDLYNIIRSPFVK